MTTTTSTNTVAAIAAVLAAHRLVPAGDPFPRDIPRYACERWTSSHHDRHVAEEIVDGEAMERLAIAIAACPMCDEDGLVYETDNTVRCFHSGRLDRY